MSHKQTPKPDEPFFVGYINAAPGSLAWFLPLVAIALIGLFAGTSFWIASGQANAGNASFLWSAGAQNMTGVIEAKPYPIVHVRPTERFPEGRTLILSGQGKRGVQKRAGELDGQVVDVRGVLLKRGELDSLQVGRLVAAQDPTGGPQEKPAPEDLGKWRLAGEICDGKCLGGAMRPNTGLSHKACANFCIIGGAPPVFVSTGKVAGQEFFVLGDSEGNPLDDRMRDFTAVPVELEGWVEKRGGVLVFKVDLDNAKRL